MKRVYLLAGLFIVAAFSMTACDTLKSIPTNTTGGLFSLNGTWRLTSTTDANAMVGTTIVVYPVVGNASAKTIQNNTYCFRENDAVWKSVKGNGAGGFSISSLVSACNGTSVYKDATIAVATTDKITVSTRTATNTELVQAWERVK
ncbi:MAG TPA: hypothetical protein VF623_10670 [Segetibacter sp.]|jgi:hypothetical protein